MWVKYYPQSWKAQEVLGVLYFQRGDYGKAKDFFLESARCGGRQRDVRIDYYLGICYLAENQLDKARFYLNAALTQVPDYPQARLAMDELSRQMKKDQVLKKNQNGD